MEEVPTQEQEKESADGACNPKAGAPGGRFRRANDAVSNQGNGRCWFWGWIGRSHGLGDYWFGRWWCWGGGNAGCSWLRGCCAWIQRGRDLRKAPGSAETVGNDLVVGGWQCCTWWKGALLGE